MNKPKTQSHQSYYYSIVQMVLMSRIDIVERKAKTISFAMMMSQGRVLHCFSFPERPSAPWISRQSFQA